MRDEAQRSPALDYPEVAGSGTFLDREMILDRTFGNVHLLQELIKLFFEECTACLADIREAIRQGNASALRRAAHLLRGSAGDFGPSPVHAAAGRLETMGRTGNLTGAEAAYFALDKALHRFQPLLAALALEPAS